MYSNNASKMYDILIKKYPDAKWIPIQDCWLQELVQYGISCCEKAQKIPPCDAILFLAKKVSPSAREQLDRGLLLQLVSRYNKQYGPGQVKSSIITFLI